MRQTNVRGTLSLRGFRKLRTGAIVATGVILLGLGFLAPTVSANEQDGVWVARTVAEVKADIQNIDNLSHYTIKWGDTLSAISGATGLSVDSLVEINRIANRDLIFANNKLYFSEEAFLKDGNTEVKRQRVSIDNSGSRQSYEVETKTDTVTGEQTTTVKQTTPVVVETPAVSAPKAEEPATPAPKVEEPATSAPKAEEPAATEPKTEEPVTPAPKAEESATPAPKVEEPATPAPKAEEPVSPALKAEEPATPAPKTEEPASGTTPKAEEPVATMPKSDEPATPASKVEEPATPAPKAEEPATPAPKVEEPATSAPKAEEPAATEPKTEEPVTPAPKAEEPATPASKVEEPAAPAPKVEEPTSPAPKVEESTSPAPKVEEPAATTPKAEEPAGTEPKTEEPAATTPKAEEPAATTPKAEEPASGTTPKAEEPVATMPKSEEPASSTPKVEAPVATADPKADEPTATIPKVANPTEVAPKDEKLEEAKKDGKDIIEKIASSKLSEIEKVKDEAEKTKLKEKLNELKDAALKAIDNAKDHDVAVDATAEYQSKIDEIDVPGEELPTPNYNKDNLTNGRNEGTTIDNGSTVIGHGSGEATATSPTQPATEERSTSTASPTQPASTGTTTGTSSFRNAPSVQARARRVARSTSEPDGTVNISYNFAGMPDIHGFLSDPGENNTVMIPAGTNEEQAKELVKEKIQAKIKDLATRGYYVKNDIIFEQDTTVKNYNYVVTFTKEATGTSGFRMAPAVQPRASRNRRSLEQPAPQKVKVNVFYNFDKMKDIAGFLGDINGTPLEIAEGSTNEEVKVAVKNQVEAKKEELSKRGYTFKEDYVYQSNGKDYNYVVTFSKVTK